MSISSGERTRKLPKVVILSPSAPPVSVGGIATAHDALYQGLKRRGFPIEFLTFADFGKARFHHDADPAVSRFGCGRLTAKGVQLLNKMRFAWAERSLRYRIYQTGDVWKARFGARRAAARLRTAGPAIVILPDQASPGIWLEKLPGQRWVQISHHQALRFVNQVGIGEHSLQDALSATRMERTQLERCDACVVPSVYMGDVVRSFVSSRAPIRVISNLVTDRPSPVGKIAPAAVRVFIPSGGSLFKGAEVVPELVARIRSGFADRGEVEFFISGSLTAKQKEAILLASPKVHLTAPGHLPHSETLAHLAQSRVCVSPTWIENQSMALLEAKALGVPFAAFDVGGNREQLGKHDRVVVRGDVEALAHAALELLGRPFSTIDAWNNQAENESALDQWSELLLSLAE